MTNEITFEDTANTVELVGTYGSDVKTIKLCVKCNVEKSIAEFYKDNTSKNGYRNNCKVCHDEQNKHWKLKNKTKIEAQRKLYLQRSDVKNRRAKLAREWSRKNIESTMLTKARARSRKLSIPCTIKKEDIVITEICPVLGIKIQVSDGRQSDFSPTLDRLIPEIGYTPGNVAVISHRANRIKSDATIKEIEMLLKWMKNETNT